MTKTQEYGFSTTTTMNQCIQCSKESMVSTSIVCIKLLSKIASCLWLLICYNCFSQGACRRLVQYRTQATREWSWHSPIISQVSLIIFKYLYILNSIFYLEAHFSSCYIWCCSYVPNPVLVIIDVQPKELGIPTKAYYDVEEVKEVKWIF